MLSNVRVIPSRANRIRAAAQANPNARPLEIARLVGVKLGEVEIAFAQGDKRRIKSVAPKA